MFDIPLTPFDGIVLEYGADGLCVPGIGIQMYTKCVTAFLYILRKTLPLSTSQELADLGTTARNWYKFLWHVLHHTVDLLHETANVKRPQKEEDVFKAAEAWDLDRIMQIYH